MGGLEVQISITGRIGPALQAALRDFEVSVVPRHVVVQTGSASVTELMRLLEAMERRGVVPDRIVRASG